MVNNSWEMPKNSEKKFEPWSRIDGKGLEDSEELMGKVVMN